MKNIMGSDASIETPRSKQITGNIGLYYCCYKLSLLGWNIMPTSRNARGIDLIAYNSDATCFHGIQIKTVSKRNAIPLGNHLTNVLGNFWIVINVVEKTLPIAYIFYPDEILSMANRNEKNGKVSYWLEIRNYDQPQFREAWDRVGRGDSLIPRTSIIALSNDKQLGSSPYG